MEIRAADAAGPVYPESEELSLRLANRNIVERAAEDERQRRLHAHKDADDQAAIVREINIEYAVSVMEAERQRRVSQDTLTQVHEQLLRAKSIKVVTELVETERSRRVHCELGRTSSNKGVVNQMEAGCIRRMSQESISIVHNELLRAKALKDITLESGTERKRRVGQDAL